MTVYRQLKKKVADPIPDVEEVIPNAGCRWFMTLERGTVCTLAHIAKTCLCSALEMCSQRMVESDLRIGRHPALRKEFVRESDERDAIEA
jgi:hypothetical protein